MSETRCPKATARVGYACCERIIPPPVKRVPKACPEHGGRLLWSVETTSG